MKQIYYTQCPMGYGLGASNGFQIKRVSPGYPVSGDFRYLGFRAFLAGTRTRAPATLRYRRGENGVAEIAWLSPRSHEYETERGFWGRPGGHFAHGLQLEEPELDAIAGWPAGLFDRPFWTRSDPIPSRGQPPSPVELSAADLRCAPNFESVAPIAASEDSRTLAQMLTALAIAVREGRTLFLIDDPARIADRIAVLTFALPTPWRKDISFSTYHDRPEELPGLRVQGTIPAARPNRLALLSLGIVADLVTGVWEPKIEPARWATALAEWFTNPTTQNRRAWESTVARARQAQQPEPLETIWADEWLDALFSLDALVDRPGKPFSAAHDWAVLTRTAEWAAQSGLSGELLDARPAVWWCDRAVDDSNGRAALLFHLRPSTAWKGDDTPSTWGIALGRWASVSGPAERQSLIARALDSAPTSAKPALVRALIDAAGAAEGQEILEWLRHLPDCDDALLLPLDVPNAIRQVAASQDYRPLRSVLFRAVAVPEATTAVLDALWHASNDSTELPRGLAEELAKALEGADQRAVVDVTRWCLRHAGIARNWLAVFLHRLFADPTNHDAWRGIARNTEPALQPALATAVLTAASDPGLPDEAYRWSVEEVLLTIPEDLRPHQPGWSGIYLDRTPSGLELFRKLYGREARKTGVRRWLEHARARGELSREQQERIEGCEQYARALKSGDARSLLEIRLPAVPAEDRGEMLAQILNYLGRSTDEALNLALDTSRETWPRAFDSGAPGLEGLAQALSDPLFEARSNPSRWFGRLLQMLGRLGLDLKRSSTFDAFSLASWIVAKTTRRVADGFDPWPLRRFLLNHDTAWRSLAGDVRSELAGGTIEARVDAFEHWDERLDKGAHTARFFEVWLNSCDGPTLAAIVAGRAKDLKSLPRLSWWESRSHESANDDLRDAFARLIPMAPVPEDSLYTVQTWLRGDLRPEKKSAPSDWEPIQVTDADEPQQPLPPASPLSPAGAARWACVDALSKFSRTGLGSGARWQTVEQWRGRLPLGEIAVDDGYKLLARVIYKLDAFDPGSSQVERLAKWLVECSVNDVERFKRWTQELDEMGGVEHQVALARAPMVGSLCDEIKKVKLDARGSAGKTRGDHSP